MCWPMRGILLTNRSQWAKIQADDICPCTRSSKSQTFFADVYVCSCGGRGNGEGGRGGGVRMKGNRGTLADSEILKVFSEIKKSCVIIRF